MNPVAAVGGLAGIVGAEAGTGVAGTLVTIVVANPVGATIVAVAVVFGVTFCVYQAIKHNKSISLGGDKGLIIS